MGQARGGVRQFLVCAWTFLIESQKQGEDGYPNAEEISKRKQPQFRGRPGLSVRPELPSRGREGCSE